MLRDLLWAYEAKRSYDRGKATGLAGLVGICLAVFIIYKWNDWFLPFFQNLGLVDMAREIGMIREGSPVLTTIIIIAFVYIVTMLVLLTVFVVWAAFMLACSFIIGDNGFLMAIGTLILIPFALVGIVVFSPFILYMAYLFLAGKIEDPPYYAKYKELRDSPESRARYLLYNSKYDLFNHTTTEDRLKRYTNSLPKFSDINTDNLTSVIIGVTNDNKMYSLLASPFYWYEDVQSKPSYEDYGYTYDVPCYLVAREFDLKVDVSVQKKEYYTKLVLLEDEPLRKIELKEFKEICHIENAPRNEFLWEKLRPIIGYQGLPIEEVKEYISSVQERYISNYESHVWSYYNYETTINHHQNIMKVKNLYSASNLEIIALTEYGKVFDERGA